MKKVLFLMTCFIIACACSSASLAQQDASKKDDAQDARKQAPMEQPDKKVVIISTPEPQRDDGLATTKATVILTAILSSKGIVTDVKFVEVVPKDLPKKIVKSFTKKSMEATRQIKFIPAQKNGRPVSMLYRIEYTFNVYGQPKETEVKPKP